MISPHNVRRSLLSLVDSMQQDPSPFVMNPGKDFTRKRDIQFRDVLLSIMTLSNHSMNEELKNYFAPLGKNIPYQSAFSMQAAKLNDDAFPFLFSEFNKAWSFKKKLKGFHLLAVDGSDLNVPADKNDCSTYIPYNSKNGGYHQMHLNVTYDILENRYTDLIIQPRGLLNEIEAACQMVDRNSVKGKCLFIYDRGYESFNLMAHVIENKQFFLIRAKNIQNKQSTYKNFSIPDDDEFDIDLDYCLVRSQKKIYREDKNNYRTLTKNSNFDYIDPSDKETKYHLSYRLIKIKLDNGTFEYLITNLPRKIFTLKDMKKLYGLRWNVEESFLFLKYDIALNFLHSFKRKRIRQEIYAKFILYNYISLIISGIKIPDDGKKRKYTYKVSFKDAVSFCRDYLLKLKNWKYTERELLRHKTPIRPNRKYERNLVSQRLRPLVHRS